MIELRALGTLALKDPNGGDVGSVLAQPKRVAVLTYLTVARPLGFHRRDALLALFWPEQDEQHARWALNQAVRHLRSALGKQVVVSRGDAEVGIDSSCLWCDAVDFKAAVDAGDSARALGLYRGDLLEGFHISGSGDFERWLEEERVWLRGQAARAASALAERNAAAGELVAAGHWARRAFALCPNDEGEARRLIELLGHVGDRAGAVQAYEEFARRLREDYEIEPTPETQAVISAVRARQRSLPRGTGEGAGITISSVVAPEGLLEDGPGESFGHAEMVAAPAALGTTRPLAPDRPWHRMPLVLGSLLLAGIGVMVWGLMPSRFNSAGSTASATTIAVFPFVYRGSPEFAYLGDGMVDLLSANLHGAGEIRTVDPHAVLALMRRASDDESEPARASSVGTRLGAGSYLLGDVVEAGGRLRINARLYAVSLDHAPVSATVQGEPTKLFQLVDGLTSQLIAGRSGGPGAGLSRIAALTTDSLAALKAYLEGERHFRAGRLDSSVQALERAIRIDSSFALAHYRMATASLWIDRRIQSSKAADRALRHSERLSYPHRRLLEAFAASMHGRIAEADRTYRELVTRYPDDLEAAYQLGDLIFHRHGILGRSWLDAREWFERVLFIDPGHQGALYHLSNIAARERKLGELDSLTNRVLQIVPPPGWGYRGQRAIVFGDTVELERFVAALRKAGDDVAHPVGGFAAFTTGDLVAGRRLWRLLAEPSRSRGLRLLAHLTLAKIELMSGRWSAAKAELEAASALDPATALEHRVLLSLWPLLHVSRSELLGLRNSLLRWKAVPGSSGESLVTAEHAPAHPYLRLYLLGLLSVRLGDHDPAVDYAAELERRAGASFAPLFISDLSRGLRAEVARARGRPDQALALLDSTGFWTREDVKRTGNSPFYEHEYEQFTRAELLFALGRHGEALQLYGAIADELFHSGAPAHLRLAQVYEAQGERRKAAVHYGRFVDLWKDCDPELRPLVEQARQRMVY
jgi:serine/threonine-protein kinase